MQCLLVGMQQADYLSNVAFRKQETQSSILAFSSERNFEM